ncbi:MAG TPA: hypothetical protein VLF43_04815 [Candidatus Saccharimonadales bacterium]|nr:hypothetical protein [Candidatus Saccharimonadales bacterium]
MSVTNLLFCGIGVVGAALLLFGFYRISSGKWTNKSVWYELDNVLGATFLIVYQLRYGAYVSAVLNAVWAGIALIGIVRFLGQYRSRKKPAKTRKRR